jgi:DNA repair protein RadC
MSRMTRDNLSDTAEQSVLADTSAQLCIRDTDGAWRPATAPEILAAARRALASRVRRGTVFTSPALTQDFLRVKLAALEHEVFCVIFLDNRHRLIEFRELFRGTIDNTTVYPREVAKEALACNAAAVIFCHNHPSGIAEPSEADQLITRRLRSALDLFEIRVLDHFVVGGDTITSLAARGML